MFISRFAVEVSLYHAIVQVNVNIKKWYISCRVRTGKFNGGVNVIKIINKNFQVIGALSPNHENIINISKPGMWFEWSIIKSTSFKTAKKKVSKGRGHFGPHGGTIVIVQETEIIHCENKIT